MANFPDAFTEEQFDALSESAAFEGKIKEVLSKTLDGTIRSIVPTVFNESLRSLVTPLLNNKNGELQSMSSRACSHPALARSSKSLTSSWRRCQTSNPSLSRWKLCDLLTFSLPTVWLRIQRSKIWWAGSQRWKPQPGAPLHSPQSQAAVLQDLLGREEVHRAITSDRHLSRQPRLPAAVPILTILSVLVVMLPVILTVPPTPPLLKSHATSPLYFKKLLQSSCRSRFEKQVCTTRSSRSKVRPVQTPSMSGSKVVAIVAVNKLPKFWNPSKWRKASGNNTRSFVLTRLPPSLH